MNTNSLVATLNDLDEQLCSEYGIARSGDAATLDEAIAMSAATTYRLLTRKGASTTRPRRSSRRVTSRHSCMHKSKRGRREPVIGLTWFGR